MVRRPCTLLCCNGMLTALPERKDYYAALLITNSWGAAHVDIGLDCVWPCTALS